MTRRLRRFSWASLCSPPFSIRPSTTFTDYANPWAGSRVNPLSQPFPNTPAKAGDRVDFRRFAPVGFTFLDPSFRTPYGQQWNLQVQYQFHQHWLLEAGYVGSNGVKLSNEREYNYAVAGPGAGNPYFRRVGSAPTFESGAGRYGNAGRNTIQAPGLSNWNLAAFKRTPVREGHDVELRAEFFNAFNHTQFGFPNTNIDSPNFGRITATNDPRIVQLSLRYRF